MQTTVDFLRHGEVSGGSYYRGTTDDPLTDLGWQQMSNAAANQNWEHIISSPLQRCHAFAQHLQQQHNIPLSVTPNWQEIDFGDWEGKTADQINSDKLMLFYQDPVNHPPENAEHFTHFLSRVDLAWNSLIKDYQGKHIVVITHAGAIRALFPLLLNLPVSNCFNIQMDHASITRFHCFHDHTDDFISLAFHNLVAPTVLTK